MRCIFFPLMYLAIGFGFLSLKENKEESDAAFFVGLLCAFLAGLFCSF